MFQLVQYSIGEMDRQEGCGTGRKKEEEREEKRRGRQPGLGTASESFSLGTYGVRILVTGHSGIAYGMSAFFPVPVAPETFSEDIVARL